jgi:hypothetical protein
VVCYVCGGVCWGVVCVEVQHFFEVLLRVKVAGWPALAERGIKGVLRLWIGPPIQVYALACLPVLITVLRRIHTADRDGICVHGCPVLCYCPQPRLSQCGCDRRELLSQPCI